MYLTRSDKPISNKVLQLNHKANMTARDNARTTSGHRRRGETYHNTRNGYKAGCGQRETRRATRSNMSNNALWIKDPQAWSVKKVRSPLGSLHSPLHRFHV